MFIYIMNLSLIYLCSLFLLILQKLIISKSRNESLAYVQLLCIFGKKNDSRKITCSYICGEIIF